MTDRLADRPITDDDTDSEPKTTESNPRLPPREHPADLQVPGFARSGQGWREYNLAAFTSRLPNVARAEQAIVDWVLRQTGQETWHGEELAVLSASRGKLRVMHRPEVQQQVAEIVRRFTSPPQHQVSMRVQIIHTSDLKWRLGLLHLLKPAAAGSDGQHVWLIAPEDAALLRNRLQADWNAPALNQRVLAANGLPTELETGRPINYIASLELQSGQFLAYQPVVARLHEGVRIELTPLWTSDGDAVDLDIRLATRAVTRLHSAQGTAPVGNGTQEAVVQVPEVAATRLEATVRWPTNRVLLISAGVQPAPAGYKRSAFQLTAPVTEVLIVAELDAPAVARLIPDARGPATR